VGKWDIEEPPGVVAADVEDCGVGVVQVAKKLGATATQRGDGKWHVHGTQQQLFWTITVDADVAFTDNGDGNTAYTVTGKVDDGGAPASQDQVNQQVAKIVSDVKGAALVEAGKEPPTYDRVIDASTPNTVQAAKDEAAAQGITLTDNGDGSYALAATAGQGDFTGDTKATLTFKERPVRGHTQTAEHADIQLKPNDATAEAARKSLAAFSDKVEARAKALDGPVAPPAPNERSARRGRGSVPGFGEQLPAGAEHWRARRASA
jgi:hypothetical protein